MIVINIVMMMMMMMMMVLNQMGVHLLAHLIFFLDCQCRSVCSKDDGDSDDDLDDATLTGWERKLMVDANQKWGRAQAIEWMKEVNLLRIILSWWIVNGV